MYKLIYIPIVAGIITGLALELTEDARSASEKTANYTQQMTDAIDCAFKGVDLEVCSPDLPSLEFEQDLTEFKTVVDQMQEQANSTYPQMPRN